MIDADKLGNLLNDSRLINAADYLIFPMLKGMIEQRVNLACSQFASGKTDFTADIAYIYGLKELEQKLRRLQTDGNRANHDLNKDNL